VKGRRGCVPPFVFENSIFRRSGQRKPAVPAETGGAAKRTGAARDEPTASGIPEAARG